MQVAKGKTIIYSGRDDDNHREGVGVLMSASAAEDLMDWTLSSERIVQASYYSRYIKLTIYIYTHTHTEDADNQVPHETARCAR